MKVKILLYLHLVTFITNSFTFGATFLKQALRPFLNVIKLMIVLSRKGKNIFISEA
jgi:hypothetical protein